MTLGKKLEFLRKEKGYSQEKLADIMNVSRQTIYKWECDAVTPERGKLNKLVEIFNVTYDYLLNDNNEYKESVNPVPNESK
jgi:transcriptional regulator with XRE-family HTH domain